MMNNKLLLLVVVLLSLMSAEELMARSPDGIWQRTTSVEKSALASSSIAGSFSFNAQSANLQTLRAQLEGAQKEGKSKGVDFYYPLPSGEYLALRVFASPVMAPKLAAKYPEIRSFQVYGAYDSQVSGRLGLSSKGLFGYVRTRNGTVVVQPESGFSKVRNVDRYRVFYQSALTPESDTTHLAPPIMVDEYTDAPLRLQKSAATVSGVGQQMRVFRLALSLTGEATRLVGGTKQDGLEFLVEAVNFLNFIFIREVGIRLEIIEKNDELIFLNPNTDPFEIPTFAHNENNDYLKSAQGIPAADYDLGHVINTHGGGQATVGQVCNDRLKGSARTGLGNNGFVTGSAVWKNRLIGVFAHEVGHQFRALHTQNSGCNRTEQDAWEVHSGSTIMSYAGVCSPSLQQNSDPMLHAGSRDRILFYISNGGMRNCGTTESVDYSPPVVNAGADTFIPTSTPFSLTATVEGGATESLTYTWDQMDLGQGTNSNPATWKDFGSGPLFRSFAPSESSTRTFPQMEVVLSDQLTAFAEILPTTERELNFRVTGRSGRGWGQDDIKLNVVGNAGPFKVLKPIGTEFDNNQTLNVEWQVANTDAAPINCAQVDIDLSVNGGLSFEQSLLQATANDGLAQVSLPAVEGASVRIRVKCSNNVFFAVSPATDLNANTDSGLITALPRLPNLNNSTILEGTSGTTDLIIDIERQNTRDQLTMEYAIGFAGDDVRSANADDFADDFDLEGVIVMPIGQKTTTLSLPIKADSDDENDLELFGLFFSNFSSGRCPSCSFLMSIRDDDEPGDNDNVDEEQRDQDQLCLPIVDKNNKTVVFCL